MWINCNFTILRYWGNKQFVCYLISMCRLILRNYFSRFFYCKKIATLPVIKKKLWLEIISRFPRGRKTTSLGKRWLSKGVATLSTNELLAILIRSGCGGESALDLSRRILLDLSNDLNTLARLSVLDFTESLQRSRDGKGWLRSLLQWN